MNVRRPPAPVLRSVWVIASVVALAIAFPIVWRQIYAHPSHRLVDLEVYREAGQSIRLGRAIYEYKTPLPQNLPFTYPPFAALLSLPLTLMSFRVAGWIWSLVSLLVLCWLVAFSFRPVAAEWGAWLASRIGARRAGLATAALAPFLLPVMIWLEPVWVTFRFGQVNIIIVALVIADCCLQWTRLPRGMLIGVATAIKLTPGLFIPYLWLTGRRRAAYVATATFVVCQLVAAALIPGDSKDYWTDALLSSERLGNNDVTANVAIRGVLLRLRVPQPTLSVVLVVAVLAVLILGMSRAILASRGGAELAAVSLVGLTSVAVSPVSWDHHLVWLVPAFAVLVADPVRRRRLLAALLLGALFYTRVPWWTSDEARSSEGLMEVVYRTFNISFTIATVLLIVLLPLKSLSDLPRSWVRGGFREG